MSRVSARKIDDDPGWVVRRFREVFDRLDSLSTGKLSSVPGSVVTIHQVLTDPTWLVDFKIDTFVATGPGDMELVLTYVPIHDSVHVYVNGIEQELDWTRVDNVVTFLDPDGDLVADDAVWVKYAHQKFASTPPTPAAPNPILIGVTEVGGDTTEVVLPVGTEAGDLLVLAVCSSGTSSAADARLTGSSVLDVGSFIKWGTADASGDPLTVSISGGAPTMAATCLAVYRGVAVANLSTNTSGTSPLGLPTFPDAYAAIGVMIGANGLAGGVLDADSTGEWAEDAKVEDDRNHTQINRWSEAVSSTSPPGSFALSSDVFGMYGFTLLLEAS